MDITLLKEGTIIMIIGMGTVFVFLVIMIYAMHLNSHILKLIAKYFPEEIPEEKATTKKKVVSSDDDVALAIACAVHQAQKA